MSDDDLIELRREIHRHPEPAGQERRTAALVAAALRAIAVGVEAMAGFLRARSEAL
ncbi:hypothetical protein [Nonomuraea sp. NPDC001831]|uniref:hypothetical protein n=1 Tax=Nonomuraea sp. NPDC001831 TaxID=3364340 RepID=UPI0036858B50